MRRKFIALLFATAACALTAVSPASAQIELFASTPNGAATEFARGASNIVSLRGTLDAPSGGQTVKVRQVDADQSCPTATGNTVPVRSTFTAYVGGTNTLPRINVSGAIDSSAGSSRFCIYAYYDIAPGGEDSPNVSYSQLVVFREVANSFTLFEVGTTVEPRQPSYDIRGLTSSRSGVLLAFVDQKVGCPETYPGGPAAVNFGPPGSFDFLYQGTTSVALGFWRACGYYQVGQTTVFGGSKTFSYAPAGGWRPSYRIRSKARIGSDGALPLGTAKCPGPCQISVVARSGRSVLAKGISQGGDVKVKATRAGRKLAKRGVRVKVTLTSTIDQSVVRRSANVTLR